MKNEILEGEIDYPLPLETDEFEKVMANLLEGCMWSVKELGYFEGALPENNSFLMKEHAVTCLKDFCTLMSTIDSKILNPADLDKIFKTGNFLKSFRVVVDGIKKHDLIGMLKKFSRSSEEFEFVCKDVIENAENYLMKAEIYLVVY